MRFYSGFGFKNESVLFKDYLDKGEFVVAGFSKGCCRAVEYAVNAETRIDKLQLISPSFFDYNEKMKRVQLMGFKRDKKRYLENFIKNSGVTPRELCYFDENEATYEELEYLLNFDWSMIEKLSDVDIEVFIGNDDKIIDVDRAVEFFRKYGTVYILKGKKHIV